MESNVPFWSDLSFRVSLGPSSWIPTFFASLKMYLQESREGWEMEKWGREGWGEGGRERGREEEREGGRRGGDN